MAQLKCKMCEGNIIPIEGKAIGVCDSCDSVVSLPSITDERRADAFNRGNHFRKVYEFDKALREYEQIIKEDPEDAEAHWCMMLCRYGINYQEDHRTGERIPTCDRVSYTSVLEDPDYKAAVKYADTDQKALYQKEVKRIYAIQQGILEVSAKEKPFDVFICFKDTDDRTQKRTKDSVLAQDLYTELTKRDYKVFFSRITLKEEHMGQEWEPYIFAALNSAKVMLVVGTTPENFNSPWVKNEWSRFLNLRRSDKTKILIPCVSGMNPNQLPGGLKELEGRDMNEISFMQDILYGIERVVRPKKQEAAVSGTGSKVSAENYVKRAYMALEDSDFKKADQLLEQALNLDPENGQAHLGKLLVERKCTSVERLTEGTAPLSRSGHYNRALKFSDLGVQQQLRAAETQITQRIEEETRAERLENAVADLEDADTSEEMEQVIRTLEDFGDYGDAPEHLRRARSRLETLKQEEAHAAEERRKRAEAEASERAAKEAADQKAREIAARQAKRKKRGKRIRRLVFWLVILCVAGYFGHKKFMKEPRALYTQAEAYMAQGDYQNAAVSYFAAADSKISRLLLKDAEEKGIEACTAWLGWEPVVVSSEDYPWLSVDESGGLQFDSEEYVEEENFTMPTILDGKLVTGFGESCFEESSGLQSLNIPANYIWIGERAFANCENLTAITLGADTERIGADAFYDCDSLTSMTMPESLQSIGERAFEDCDYLNSVTLNVGLLEIGEGAFRDCGSITDIYIPGTVQLMSFEAFYGTSLTSLTLESGVTSVGERAFAECDYLTSVTIPGSVTEIGPRAFYSCDALGTVVLESGVETVGEEAFSYCEQLWSLAISDTLTSVGNRAFYQNSALGSISLPGTLTSIGEEAFSECDGMNELWIADNGGLTVGTRAFYSCDSLAGVSIGAGTESLGDSAFDYCENLSWLSLPEGLTAIGAWCFSNDALSDVTIPSTVTSLGEGAFNNNDNLAGVAVPAGITIIESDTFAYCDNLYWVWFAEGLTIVRDDAFYGSDNLAQVYFSGSQEAWYTVSKGNNSQLDQATLYADYYG